MPKAESGAIYDKSSFEGGRWYSGGTSSTKGYLTKAGAERQAKKLEAQGFKTRVLRVRDNYYIGGKILDVAWGIEILP